MPGPDKAKLAVFNKAGYKPHPSQWKFHNSTARFKIPACGRRFGKSNMAAAELLVNDKANIFDEGKMFWIVGPKYTHGAKEFRYLRNFLRRIPGRRAGKSLWDECPQKAFNIKQGVMHVIFPWDTEVHVLSAQHKDNLIGEGVDGVIVSEAARQSDEIWPEYLRPTLADHAPDTWAVFPSTPKGFNWFYNHFNKGVRRSADYNPEFESWNFPSWENPYVYPGGEKDPEIVSLKATMDDDEFWQEIGASFRSVVGLVYGGEWDDDIHIYEERFNESYVYNPMWKDFTAVDFGFSNPFCVLDIQVDPMDNVYVWREHYLERHSTPQHISILRERRDPEGYKVLCGYGDAAYPDGVEQLSMALWPVSARAEYKDWQRGIDEVKKLLQGSDGQPKLFISRNCPNTIREMQSYRLKEKTKSDLNAKEEPRKDKDHAMDALRYFVMGYFVYGAGGFSLADVVRAQVGAEKKDEGGFFTLGSPDSAFSLDSMNY